MIFRRDLPLKSGYCFESMSWCTFGKISLADKMIFAPKETKIKFYAQKLLCAKNQFLCMDLLWEGPGVFITRKLFTSSLFLYFTSVSTNMLFVQIYRHLLNNYANLCLFMKHFLKSFSLPFHMLKSLLHNLLKIEKISKEKCCPFFTQSIRS